MSANAASIVAAIGATGSGKSLWVKQGIQSNKPARLLIWDPQGEYAEFGQVFTNGQRLFDHVARAKKFAAVYQPGDLLSLYEARFDWFCKLAYALGDLLMVVEELADVTEPSHAPDSWSVITRKGRHKKLRVVAMSQRPASVDKDFFSNCTMIHCGRVLYSEDVKTMARVLGNGVSQTEIQAMAQLEFIEKNMLTGELRRGKLEKPA